MYNNVHIYEFLSDEAWLLVFNSDMIMLSCIMVVICNNTYIFQCHVPAMCFCIELLKLFMYYACIISLCKAAWHWIEWCSVSFSCLIMFLIQLHDGSVLFRQNYNFKLSCHSIYHRQLKRSISGYSFTRGKI